MYIHIHTKNPTVLAMNFDSDLAANALVPHPGHRTFKGLPW